MTTAAGCRLVDPPVVWRLQHRLRLYFQRYQELPGELPVDLDEWGRLAGEMNWRRFDYDSGYVPTHFASVPLRLVSEVIDWPDQVMVWP